MILGLLNAARMVQIRVINNFFKFYYYKIKYLCINVYLFLDKAKKKPKVIKKLPEIEVKKK